ncbi:MAG TPA: endolytic transglycosylase MltG [Clostridiales bacterium]|nr:endolytic transglycosylase MltG [Clostridiales bacterium]
MKKILVVLIILVGLGIGFVYNFYNDSLTPVDNGTTKIITIEQGASSDEIGTILLENNLIKNLTVYKLYLRQSNLGSQLKAGDFEISDSLSLPEIVDLLIQGENVVKTMNFTVPEGLNLKEIGKILSEKFDFTQEEFLKLTQTVGIYRENYEFLQDDEIKTLEGFLYPNTYNVYIDSTADDIIITMLNGFEEIYEEHIKGNTGDRTVYEIVNMASVVEGEAQVDEERPVIAGVFYNRLEMGMMLQSCATVQYALGEKKERLLNEDLKVESLYNTYLHTGLPVAPINSPGLTSIKAALNPEETDYIYFLAKGDGSHYFTDDYDDFLDAKAKYIN